MTAPNAPIWVAPANLAYLDLAADGLDLSVLLNDPDVGDTLSALAVRRRVAGAGTYQWWTGSAWTGVLTWFADTDGVYHIPNTAWTNGVDYQIAVNTKDQGGTAGSYNAERLVHASTRPVFNLTGPVGPVNTSRPYATWTFVDAEADAMVGYRLVLYPSTVYGLVGFNPETFTAQAVWDSAVVPESTDTAQIEFDVQQGVTYRLYGWAWQTGNLKSNVDYQQFGVDLTQPNPPELLLTPDVANGRMTLDLSINLNLLSASDANMEAGLSGWVSENSATISSSSVWTAQGTKSIAILVAPVVDDLDADYAGMTMDQLDAAFAGQTMDQLDGTFF